MSEDIYSEEYEEMRCTATVAGHKVRDYGEEKGDGNVL
jgi:hypothetical protein